MNLRSLSNQELHIKTQSLAQDERHITAEILHHLRELDSRRYFAELGYTSLYDYCLREHHYSEASAHRRISAMRLLREIPELESSIEAGKITLSNLSTLQTFFQAEKRNQGKTYSTTEKLELAQSLEGKSKRECEKELAEISPTAIPKEHTRAVGSGQETQISFVASEALMRKLKQIQDLAARNPKAPGKSYAALFEWMADRELKRLDPAIQGESARKKTAAPKSAPEPQSRSPHQSTSPPPPPAAGKIDREEMVKADNEERMKGAVADCDVREGQVSHSRYIPAQVRRAVWKRDGGRCQFISEAGKHKCDATYALHVDHIQAFALGGSSTDPGNLRLACRQHNTLYAIRTFGERVMRAYAS